MPCGDSTVFPVNAAATAGREMVSKQFTKDFAPAVCDLVCYANTTFFPGGKPIPLPTPTFGAGLDDRPDADEVERIGHALVVASQEHHDAEHGFKAAQDVGAFQWENFLKIAFTIVQGILQAIGENPIPKPNAQSGKSVDENEPFNANEQPSPVNANVPHNTPAEKSKTDQSPKPDPKILSTVPVGPKPAPPAVAPKPADKK